MGQTVYKIPRINDEQINDHLIEIGQKFGDYNVNIYIGDINTGQVTYPDCSSENIKSILAMRSELISSISGNINGVSFGITEVGVLQVSGKNHQSLMT